MGEGYNFEQLKSGILKLSDATDWDVAKKEWRLVGVFEADENETCLCTHYPIREICTLENRLNRNQVEVGNVCVKRFLGFRSDLIFNSIKKIRNDLSKSINEDTIVFLKGKQFINDWEYKFLQNTHKKRNLTPAQLEKRAQINKKILLYIKTRGI